MFQGSIAHDVKTLRVDNRVDVQISMETKCHRTAKQLILFLHQNAQDAG